MSSDFQIATPLRHFSSRLLAKLTSPLIRPSHCHSRFWAPWDITRTSQMKLLLVLAAVASCGVVGRDFDPRNSEDMEHMVDACTHTMMGMAGHGGVRHRDGPMTKVIARRTCQQLVGTIDSKSHGKLRSLLEGKHAEHTERLTSEGMHPDEAEQQALHHMTQSLLGGSFADTINDTDALIACQEDPNSPRCKHELHKHTKKMGEELLGSPLGGQVLAEHATDILSNMRELQQQLHLDPEGIARMMQQQGFGGRHADTLRNMAKQQQDVPRRRRRPLANRSGRHYGQPSPRPSGMYGNDMMG
ncbi:MAG: hypothetical protein MHM6MM_002321 [Cercozoa sp. M6MM]